MNAYQKLVILAATGVALAACAGPAGPVEPTRHPTSHPTQTVGDEQTVSNNVKSAVAQQLGLTPDQVEVLTLEKAEWPDGCLGLPLEGEVCIQIVVLGYGGAADANGQPIEFRTNATGDLVRVIPDAALLARQMLAQQRRLNPQEVNIVAVEQAEWPDACLGIALPGVMCAQVIVPGFRVILEVDGGRYEYHTDESGSDIRLASAPAIRIPDVVIEWTQPAEVPCRTATIGNQTVAFGVCNGPLTLGTLLPEMNRLDELAYFAETYAAFEADTPAGLVKLAGKGSMEATRPEQRMIAEWAQVVYDEATGGRSGASYGLVFTWHREGGVAGFCDDLSVYVYGLAFAASCRSAETTNLRLPRLTSDQLQPVFDWMDKLKSFEFEQSDSATADSMTIRVVFTGRGIGEPTESDRLALLDFAAQLFAKSGP